MTATRILVVYGTRPEAVKLAPLIHALRASDAFVPIVAVTAQHRLMLDQVNEFFDIEPDHDLGIMENCQSLTDVNVRALRGLDRVLEQERPDAVVVQGDTTSAFAGALAAFYHQVPVVHVEAGLRTFDRYAPFPEEMNRQLLSRLADLHLAPTITCQQNLMDEGVDSARIVVTGNTVIDALLCAVAKGAPYHDAQLEALDHHECPVLLVTAHRRESLGAPMEALGRALARIAMADLALTIVVPMHKNPAVRAALLPRLAGQPNIIITDPLPYGAFCRLMNRATIILTDSGGVQEEAPSLGKPVLVFRDTTERLEAIAAGTARLVGTDEERVVAGVTSLLRDRSAYRSMAKAVNPYGDGHAAGRSVEALTHFLTGTTFPDSAFSCAAHGTAHAVGTCDSTGGSTTSAVAPVAS